MFRTSVWMRTKRVFSWDDGMFNTVMAAGWQDWEWSMIRWRCFRSLINSTLSHSRRRIRPWTKYSVFVQTDKCICSDLRSVWSTLSEDTDLTLNILMPVIRHATQWYGPYHTAATRSVMTLSSDTMASRISDISAALCSCTVYATHCFRRRIIMSVWKCDTVCVYWQSVSLEWPTNRLDFDHHPTSLQFNILSTASMATWCFLASRWRVRGQTPLHTVEEPHIQREGRYPYEGEEARLFLLFSLKNNNLQGKLIFKNPPSSGDRGWQRLEGGDQGARPHRVLGQQVF